MWAKVVITAYVFLIIAGSHLCTCQADPEEGEEKPLGRIQQLSQQQTWEDVNQLLSKVGETLPGTQPATPFQDVSVSDSGRKTTDVRSSPSAQELQLVALRQQLALDETKRNVPAALRGYQEIFEGLEQHLHDLPAQGTDAEPDEGKDASEDDVGQAVRADLSEADQAPDEQLAAAAAAAFELAVMTLTGLAGGAWPRNETLGMHMLHAAAKGGSMEAELSLSNRYMLGEGVPQDCEEAIRRGKRAALNFIDQTERAGAFQPPVQPLLLRERWRSADFLPPLPGLLHQAAHARQVDGFEHEPLEDVDLFDLMQRDQIGDFGAWQWLQGFPTMTEQETTLQVLRRLAAQGDPDALFNLGYMHLRGIDTIPRNATAAYLLFTAAKLKGSAAAYNALGVMLYSGQDMPVDYEAALDMFDTGALLGDADAMFNLGAMHLAGHGVEPSPQQALAHFQEANDADHWQAPFQLALAYQRGQGTAKDCTLAAKHLNTFLVERAPWHDDIYTAVETLDSGDEWKALVQLALIAEQGSTAAQHDLAFALEQSKTFLLPERYSLAYDMYLRVGKSGYLPAALTDAAHLVWNGHLYQLPSGTNRTKALELYEQASDQGDTEGTFYLARAYQAGSGVKRNATHAVELYRAAISKAPSERFAVAPFLALVYLRFQIAERALRRLLAGSVMKIVHWDLAVLTALASGLATVLWLRWQRRRAAPPPRHQSQ